MHLLVCVLCEGLLLRPGSVLLPLTSGNIAMPINSRPHAAFALAPWVGLILNP
jgi:hypothetical protein